MAEENTDNCTIKVDGQVFTAKKTKLIERSEYFKDKLNNDSCIDITQELSNPDIKKAVHDITLNKMFLNELNMIDVWKACVKLEVKELSDFCEKYIARHLVKSNYLLLYQNALNMNSVIVTNKIITLIDENFTKFSKTNFFLELVSETLIQLIDTSKFIPLDDLVKAVDQWLCEYDDTQAVQQAKPGHVNETSLNSTVENQQGILRPRKERKGFEVRLALIKKVDLNVNQLSELVKLIFNEIEKRYLLFKTKPLEIPAWLAKEFQENRFDPVNFIHDEQAIHPVAVYVKSNKFYVYNLAKTANIEEKDKYTELKLPINEQIQDFYVYNNVLYFTKLEKDKIQTFKVTGPTTFELFHTTCVSLNERRYFLMYPSVYEFKLQNNYLRVSSFQIDTNEREWNEERNMSLNDTEDIFDCILSTLNNIVFMQKGESIYYDLNTKQFSHLSDEWPFKQSSTVLSADECIFLNSAGQTYEIFESVKGLHLQGYSLVIWLHSVKDVELYGATIYNNTYYVFTDDTRNKEKWFHYKGAGFLDIRYVPLNGNKQKCVFMNVPDNWLLYMLNSR